MTFEEFFQKKRIDLTSLQVGEPALFFEFKTHFEQMGEKSFDHTKKYWFNKLRLLYHLAPEQKPEKMHLENRLAEQTILETLTESIPEPSKPVESKVESQGSKGEETETIAESSTPKPAGFKPRFNPKMVAPKAETKEGKVVEPTQPGATPVAATPVSSAEPLAPKPAGFKPRFNAKVMAPKTEAAEEKVEDTLLPESTDPEASAEPPAPKPAGFKPRFNAKMMAPKPEVVEEKVEGTSQPEDIAPETPTELPAPKPAGFKPRFNAKMMAPKPAEEGQPNPEITEPVAETTVAIETAAEPDISADETTPKPVGFKPRFNAAKMKPKPPQE
ncbi:hypothetical protein [Mucilaginibacter sp.]|uniref:hypothetical protein n=1 Tax=Mucilaginibacter sp. TaxID=1882438 RepID=UPI0032678480